MAPNGMLVRMLAGQVIVGAVWSVTVIMDGHELVPPRLSATVRVTGMLPKCTAGRTQTEREWITVGIRRAVVDLRGGDVGLAISVRGDGHVPDTLRPAGRGTENVMQTVESFVGRVLVGLVAKTVASLQAEPVPVAVTVTTTEVLAR